MGVFDATCLLSNLPIRSGKVMFIMNTRSYDNGTYDLLTSLHLDDRNEKEREEFRKHDVIGFFQEYKPKVIAIAGEYDWYGKIEGLGIEYDEWIYNKEVQRAFVRKDVLVDLDFLTDKEWPEDGELFNRKIVQEVVGFAFVTRQEVPTVVGQQHYDISELKSHIRLARTKLKITRKMIEEYEE